MYMHMVRSSKPNQNHDLKIDIYPQVNDGERAQTNPQQGDFNTIFNLTLIKIQTT